MADKEKIENVSCYKFNRVLYESKHEAESMVIGTELLELLKEFDVLNPSYEEMESIQKKLSILHYANRKEYIFKILNQFDKKESEGV